MACRSGSTTDAFRPCARIGQKPDLPIHLVVLSAYFSTFQLFNFSTFQLLPLTSFSRRSSTWCSLNAASWSVCSGSAGSAASGTSPTISLSSTVVPRRAASSRTASNARVIGVCVKFVKFIVRYSNTTRCPIHPSLKFANVAKSIF